MYLENFKPMEFREWWGKMSENLIIRLDILRFRIGKPITISANPQALGRHNGPLSESDHNYSKWGEVRGVDCFIVGIKTKDQAAKVVKVAKELGLTAIGVYPEWVNNQGEIQVGFHFGFRESLKMGHPATWGQVGGEYVSLQHALDMIGE